MPHTCCFGKGAGLALAMGRHLKAQQTSKRSLVYLLHFQEGLVLDARWPARLGKSQEEDAWGGLMPGAAVLRGGEEQQGFCDGPVWRAQHKSSARAHPPPCCPRPGCMCRS